MEEKVLVTGKVRFSSITLKICAFSGSIILGLITIFFIVMAEFSQSKYARANGLLFVTGDTVFETQKEYWRSLRMFFGYWYIPMVFTVIFFILGIIIYIYWSKSRLTITDKRVYGTSIFGQRIDLPIDSISAVGTSWLWGIDVGSSSGKIHFKFIQNRDSIHAILSNLLLERQRLQTENKSLSQKNATVPSSNADELKKYKDLLDNGVITQEEFDAKKKQLLGL